MKSTKKENTQPEIIQCHASSLPIGQAAIIRYHYTTRKGWTVGTPTLERLMPSNVHLYSALDYAEREKSKAVFVWVNKGDTLETWFYCADCKDWRSYTRAHNGGASGYATIKSDARIEGEASVCYDCAAKREANEMSETGNWIAYLVRREDGYHVTDWTGKIDFKADNVTVKERLSNRLFTTRTYYATFTDSHGRKWTGTNKEKDGDIFVAKRIN